MGPFGSPFIVPLGAFLVAIVAIVSGIVGQAHARRLKAEQRMAMVQRGMTAEQIDLVLRSTRDDGGEIKTRDPLFGTLLAAIERDRETLVVSACGLIPLAIGIGFFVDYHLQKRELARFGLEVAADPPPNNPPR